MKAPDKIYLPKEEIEERKPWIETAYDPNWDECYIRKDALMEWIQEVRAIPHENAIVRDLAFQEIVNKLNSM